VRKPPEAPRCWRPPPVLPPVRSVWTNRRGRRHTGGRAPDPSSRRLPKTGVGFPVLQPRLPDPDPAHRCRNRAHRTGEPRRSPIDVSNRSPTCWQEDEWICNAADQDLPCLAEVACGRRRFYDTSWPAGWPDSSGSTSRDGAASGRAGPGQGPRPRDGPRPAAAGLAELRRPGRRGLKARCATRSRPCWRSKQKPIGRRRIRVSALRRGPGHAA